MTGILFFLRNYCFPNYSETVGSLFSSSEIYISIVTKINPFCGKVVKKYISEGM